MFQSLTYDTEARTIFTFWTGKQAACTMHFLIRNPLLPGQMLAYLIQQDVIPACRRVVASFRFPYAWATQALTPPHFVPNPSDARMLVAVSSG